MSLTTGAEVRKLLITRARDCIGISTYRRDATREDAPHTFNCFRFTQWLWSLVGVQLPDQQLSCCEAIPVALKDVAETDLVFVPRLNYKLDGDNFGHVGVATESRTVIHASKWKGGVVEEPLPTFIDRGVLGVRRIAEESYPYIER